MIIPSLTLAEKKPGISVLLLDRPVWASGLKDAKWLFQTSKKKYTIAFFSLSMSKSNMPSKITTQKEDDTGRTTRSLPLYLAERVNVGSSCSAVNYIFVIKGAGPVVSKRPWEFHTLVRVLGKDMPDFIVFGHYNQDYFNQRSIVTIELWSVKKKSKLFQLKKTSLFSGPSNVAAKVPDLFQEKLEKNKLCAFSRSARYPKPTPKLLPAYLDGLGQLLMQTLADNNVIPASSIWGEENMLAWYRHLWKYMPQSDASKLMFARGIITSKRYGGNAHKTYSPIMRKYLLSEADKGNVLVRLSPLYYAEFGYVKDCKRVKSQLQVGSKVYLKWLDKIDCQSFNKR